MRRRAMKELFASCADARGQQDFSTIRDDSGSDRCHRFTGGHDE